MKRLLSSLSFVAFLVSCGATSNSFVTPSTGDGGTCTDTWSTYGAAFFPSACGGCHQNLTSHAGISSSRTMIRSQVVSGRMPPAGLSWTDEQRVVLYLDCGAL